VALACAARVWPRGILQLRLAREPPEAQLREWAADLEKLKARADRTVAEARKEYYEHVDELRAEIETKLKTWSKSLEATQAKAGDAEAAARTLVERFHPRDPGASAGAPAGAP
jgi:ElaB/YqjD/DUF883 family membrane-anchored ribosome-binding protein